MNCTEARSLYDDDKDGRLDAGTAGRLTAHLSHCPACAHEFRDRDALGALCRQLPRAEAPAGFESLLRARLSAPGPQGRRKTVSWRQGILVAASALLAMGLGFTFNLWRPAAPRSAVVLQPAPGPSPREFVVPVLAPGHSPADPGTIRFVTKDRQTGDDIYVELPASYTPKDMKAIESRYLTEVSY